MLFFSTGLLRCMTFIVLARSIQPFLSLVDREVEFLCTNNLIVLHFLGIYSFSFSFFLFLAKKKDKKGILVKGFDLITQCVIDYIVTS